MEDDGLKMLHDGSCTMGILQNTCGPIVHSHMTGKSMVSGEDLPNKTNSLLEIQLLVQT